MNEKIKIALCYFGMMRSTKQVHTSHYKYIFNILKQVNIDYDTYIHTWKTQVGNRIWDKISDVPIDYEEYKLLQPNYYQIDDQDDFTKTLDFSKYFYQYVYDTVGHSVQGEWLPGLVLNHLCALESQKRVTEMYEQNMKVNNIAYDAVIFIRPDVEIHDPLPIHIFSGGGIGENDLYIPNFDHYEGFNDRFAIGHPKSIVKYSKRIDEIATFRANHGRIVSEKYTKYIAQKYFDIVLLNNFKFTIVRPININNK